MDKIRKFLSKLTAKEQIIICDILQDIQDNNIQHYDSTKLVNSDDQYRIRKWNIRIVFQKSPPINKIINIDYRGISISRYTK